MAESRLFDRFQQRRGEGRAALVAYLTAGDPSPDRTADLALALERGGADVIELGVPFSDPIADGPVIQRASERALKAGTRLERVLEIAGEIRARSDVPVILFSYLNPLLRYGFEKLAGEAVRRGVDGVLLTDLSVEEAGEPVEALRKAGLATVFLAAPTSTRERLSKVAGFTTGFVYVVSRAGVTGEQASVASGVRSLVEQLRAYTSLPVAVGFGVSTAEHAREIAAYADGVVVGSAVMRLVEQHASAPDLEARLEEYMRSLRNGMDGGRP
jgi:tryptophan synthase alpha chain